MRISDWSSDVCSSDLLVQGGLGLPDRDYYLSDDAGLVGKRNAYRDYLVPLLTLAGEPNAEARAAAILTLESDIAEAHWTQVDSRDAQDRKSVVWGQSVSVRVDTGCRRDIQKKTKIIKK